MDETLNHLIDARDLEYCPVALYEQLRTLVEEVRRLLNGYIGWLKEKKIGENEPGAKLAVGEVSADYTIDADKKPES